MKRWRGVVGLGVVGVIGVVGCVLAASPVRADCVCNPFRVPDAVAAAAAVFEGRLASVESPAHASQAPNRARFEVLRVWKGDVPRNAAAIIPSPLDECGAVIYQVGRTYLVYATVASFDPRSLRVAACSRSALISDAAEDLRFLGPPHGTPTGGSSPAPSARAQLATTEPAEPPRASLPAPSREAPPPEPIAPTPPGSGGCASCTVEPGHGGDRAIPLLAAGIGVLAFCARRCRDSRR